MDSCCPGTPLCQSGKRARDRPQLDRALNENHSDRKSYAGCPTAVNVLCSGSERTLNSVCVCVCVCAYVHVRMPGRSRNPAVHPGARGACNTSRSASRCSMLSVYGYNGVFQEPLVRRILTAWLRYHVHVNRCRAVERTAFRHRFGTIDLRTCLRRCVHMYICVHVYVSAYMRACV